MENWVRLLFALFLFAAWAVRSVKAARDRAAAARGNQPVTRGPHGEPIDAEAEERQRKVRAEVARKIAERKILMMPSARLASPTLPPKVKQEEEAAEPPPPPVRTPAPTPARAPERPVVWATEPSPIFSPSPIVLTASQTALAEDFERWSAITPDRQGFGGQAGRVTLEDLHAPAALRRAVLMREILGPPVGLR